MKGSCFGRFRRNSFPPRCSPPLPLISPAPHFICHRVLLINFTHLDAHSHNRYFHVQLNLIKVCSSPVTSTKTIKHLSCPDATLTSLSKLWKAHSSRASRNWCIIQDNVLSWSRNFSGRFQFLKQTITDLLICNASMDHCKCLSFLLDKTDDT